MMPSLTVSAMSLFSSFVGMGPIRPARRRSTSDPVLCPFPQVPPPAGNRLPPVASSARAGGGGEELRLVEHRCAERTVGRQVGAEEGEDAVDGLLEGAL